MHEEQKGNGVRLGANIKRGSAQDPTTLNHTGNSAVHRHALGDVSKQYGSSIQKHFKPAVNDI